MSDNEITLDMVNDLEDDIDALIAAHDSIVEAYLTRLSAAETDLEEAKADYEAAIDNDDADDLVAAKTKAENATIEKTLVEAQLKKHEFGISDSDCDGFLARFESVSTYHQGILINALKAAAPEFASAIESYRAALAVAQRAFSKMNNNISKEKERNMPSYFPRESNIVGIMITFLNQIARYTK